MVMAPARSRANRVEASSATASPRKIDRLEMAEPSAKNPFTFALNEIGGRAALINFLVHNRDGEGSERFGAKLLTLKEVP